MSRSSQASTIAKGRFAPAPLRARGALVLLAVAIAAALATWAATSRPQAPVAPAEHALPPTARASISATIGADEPVYRALALPGGALLLRNPAQRLQARFGRDGVALAAGALRISLGAPSLDGRALAQSAPAARGNRVRYATGAVAEWYANGPFGLEQGFTVLDPPARGETLTLSLSLAANTRATLAADRQSIAFGHALSYAGLLVTDARGRRLPSWLGLGAGRLAIHVDARGARYPLRIDPFFQQGPKLTGTEAAGAGEAGASVALSADGNTALVGAPADNGGVGAAWVFTRSGSTWEQQGPKLTGKEESGSGRFGFSVALSEGGSTAFVGGGADNSAAGAAWAFVRTEGKWEQQGAKLTGGEEKGAGHVGFSVALSGDGATALVGGVGDNNEAGAAWAFVRTEGKWEQQGPKLTGGEEKGAGLFGSAVALSSNGDAALVGGEGDNGSVGAAWVFARSGSTWAQQGGKLTGEGESGAGLLGAGAALSAAGDTALLGGPGDASGAGAAWAFADVVHPPTVVTGAASAVSTSSATLGATVNPNGQTVTDCHFNYGTTTAYGASVPCATAPGSGSVPVPVSAEVSGLSPGATYHFQIVATNATGTSEGADGTFTTASPPEYGTCVKVGAGVTGRFATSTCTSAATAEKHAYEWVPGPPAKARFTTKIKELSSVLLETVRKTRLTCTGQTGAGEYTGRKTVGAVVFTFTGCESGGLKCASAGAAEGEVLTSALVGALGVVTTSKEGPLKNKVGLDLQPAVEGGPVLEASCGATTVLVRGSAIVPVSIDKMLSKATLSFTEGGGKQKPEAFEGLPKDVLEASFAGGSFEQQGLKLVTVQTDEAAIEINSTV